MEWLYRQILIVMKNASFTICAVCEILHPPHSSEMTLLIWNIISGFMNFLIRYPTTAELNPREYCVLGNLSAVAVHQRGSHFCNEDQNLWKLLHPPPFAKKTHYHEESNRNDGKLAPVLVPTGSSPFPRPLLALSHSSSPRLPSVSKKSIYYIFHKTGLIFEADVDMRDLWAAVEEEKYGWASNWPRLNNNPLYKDVPNLVERGKSMAM